MLLLLVVVVMLSSFVQVNDCPYRRDPAVLYERIVMTMVMGVGQATI